MAKPKRSERLASLSQGRPPNFRKPAASLSSRATRTLIRSHHQLQQAKTKAIADGDEHVAASLSAQIERQGGLEAYQQASITGQSFQRGGDTSKLLMQWLRPFDESLKAWIKTHGKLRMLEVGALSVNNACSRSGIFDMTRIDLHSQDERILQQDFMERPLPSDDEQKVAIISLSLVLNFVPTAEGRGEMLRRTCKFLRRSPSPVSEERYFPSLFLVLPAPCLINSRYLDEKRFSDIMTALGYSLIKRKLSAKLIYFLWAYENERESKQAFPKIEVSRGSKRNNFAVTLK